MEYMKICFKCKQAKPLTEFYKHKEMADGHLNKCIACTKRDVQHNYQRNIDYYHNYDKNRQRMSVQRILDHRYTGIKMRVEGRATRPYKVAGKDMLTREEWNWWNSLPEVKQQFTKLYDAWKATDYKDARLAPSVDRKDNSKGYTLGNIQWLSRSENSKKFDH